MVYRIERASASYRMTFQDVLSALPQPGTAGFGELCRALRPFDLTVEGINFRALPSARLADVVLECSFLRGRATLRVTHGWIELAVSDLNSQDTKILPVALESAVQASVTGDPSVLDATTTRVAYSAHLALNAGDLETFLSTYLIDNRDTKGLAPDAFAYAVGTIGDRSSLEVARVVFAKSLVVPQGLYLEFFLEFAYPMSPSRSVARAESVIWTALEHVGIARQAESPKEPENA